MKVFCNSTLLIEQFCHLLKYCLYKILNMNHHLSETKVEHLKMFSDTDEIDSAYSKIYHDGVS